MKKQLIQLVPCAKRLGVTPAWLRQEAEKGRVPCVDANGTFLFNLAAVRSRLAEMAAHTHLEASPCP